jgi:hypothetical protein
VSTFKNIKPKKLDLACGTRKKDGFTGVDSVEFDGVDIVWDLTKFPWPWETDSVEETHCFPGNQLVSTSNGSVQISKLSVGDTVLGRTGDTRVRRVLTKRYAGRIYSFKTGECSVEATASHPVSTPNGWIKAEKLRETSQILRIPPKVQSTDFINRGYVVDSVTGVSTFCSDTSMAMIVGNSALTKRNNDFSLATFGGEKRHASGEQLDQFWSAANNHDCPRRAIRWIPSIFPVIGPVISNTEVIQNIGTSGKKGGIAVCDGDLALNLSLPTQQADGALSINDTGKVCEVCVGHVENLQSYYFVGTVYNLLTEDETFFADGVLTHNCSHFIEHLTNFDDRWERVKFFNELWRVTKNGGTCTLIFPHWASNRYYGDPTHCEPLSELTFYYLDPEWRGKEAPHTDIKYNPNGYSCNWHCQWGYGMHPSLQSRSQEYRQHALEWYRDSILDMHVTMTAKK